MTDQSVTDRNATDQSVTDRNATDQSVTDQNATEEQEEPAMPDEQASPGKQASSGERPRPDERATPEPADEQAEAEQDGASGEQSAMDPRVKASLLWGAIGLLGFLVLLQGYELWTGFRYSLVVKVAVALLVGLGATGLSYAAEPRLFE